MLKTLHLISRASRHLIQQPGNALLLLRMSWWVCFLSVCVKVQPLPKVLGMLSAPARDATPENNGDNERQLATAIDTILKTEVLCFEPICWKRAAVLHRYLGLNGIATRIVFGMRKDSNGQLHGHAWLEANGKPILEAEPPDYVITYTFPSNARFDLELSTLNE